MGAPSRGSFRSCFVIAGPCLLVIVVISIFLCQNLAQVDRGHIARHALQLQELIFAPSSDGTAPPTAANAGTADVVPEVAVETSSSTIAPLVEEKKERGNSSDPGAVEWFDSSYFATVPREKTLKCPLEATVNQWNGRLGNHIHQILNMVLFAHLCSIAEVHFPKHQDNTHAYSHQIGLLDMPTTLSFPPREQILNHPLKCPRHSRHTHPWFGNYCFTNTPMWVYHQLALHFVRPYLGDYIRECLTIPEDADAEQTLTVHMRADDVAKYPEYSWGQPPCSMYEKIIKENKFSRIIFVKKGDAPCAKRLLAVAEEAQISVTYPPAFDETNFKPWHMRIFYRETHNLATDFCTLMRARHLVLSYSTFSVSAALLSTSIKTMYRRREALWESYLKSPGINCNTWPGVTMYDYGIQTPKNKTRHGSVEWLTNYPISEIGGPTACSYDPRQEAALFSQSKVLHMTLPREGMTPREVAEMWTEWGVPHAQRIKFKLLGAAQCLQPHLDSLPLAPNVVLLEGKGSVLLALEGACRKRTVQMESLRSGEAFSWPSWTPEQVLDDHHRKMSEEQMTRWREEGQQKPPAPPADEPRARVPLIDPYAPATCYPVPPPEPPRLPVEPPRPQVSAPPPAPRRESFPQAKPAVSSVKAMPQPKVAVSAKPAKAEPAGESWSSKQQRLKKEQREARLAENLRRRAARGGDEEVKNGRPSHEDAVLHSAENSQDPQSSSFPVKEEPPSQTSKAGGGVDAEPKEAEIDLQGVPLRVLRSKQPSGSGLLSWGKPKIGQ